MIDINPEEVLTWDIEKLWNTTKQLVNEQKYKKELHQIKFGINIEFPIHYIIYEWFELHPVSKKATIKGYGKYKLQPFIDEVEQREELMREIILENIGKEEIATPRT